MPVMDGDEATKQIKAASDRAPVIIALTGSAFAEDPDYYFLRRDVMTLCVSFGKK